MQLLFGGLVDDLALLALTAAAVLGGLVAVVVTRRRIAEGEQPNSALSRTVVDVAMFAAVAGVLAVTVLPNRYGAGGTNLVPFASMGPLATRSVDVLVAIRNVIGNILLFAPLGFLLAFRRRAARPLWSALFGALSLSLLVEMAQGVLPLGRSVDIDDVILNVAGALLGGMMALMLVTATRRLQYRSTTSGSD